MNGYFYYRKFGLVIIGRMDLGGDLEQADQSGNHLHHPGKT